MTQRHLWARFRDFVGNVWCAIEHHPRHWYRWEYPPGYPGFDIRTPEQKHIGDCLAGPEYVSPIPHLVESLYRQFPVWTCERCGRAWLEHEGKFLALTHCGRI